jgi:hypothetical protein
VLEGFCRCPHETPVAKGTPATAAGVSLILNNSMKYQKPQVHSVGSQTCITTISSCEHAVYEWEFQEGDTWISMDVCTSAAIEVSLRSQRKAPDDENSAARGDSVLVHGNYEFNLSCMKQKNINSQRLRSIRRGRIVINSWESVFETNKAVELKLSQVEDRCKKMVAASRVVQEHNKALEMILQQSGIVNEKLVHERNAFQEKNDALERELSMLKQSLALHTASSMIIKSERDIAQARIVRMQPLQVRDLARIKELEVGNEALKLQIFSSDFQFTILQLLHATRSPLSGPCASARMLCSSAMLSGFRKSVENEFFGTRAAHRKNLQPVAEICKPPEYEVLNVEVVINPGLAERQRQFVLQAESGGVADHRYRAHRLTSSVREGMKVKRLCGGNETNECVDEGMLLGWHGTSDDIVDKIIAKGFNPCCAGSGAGSLFGKGLYFAENSSKADLYAGPHGGRFQKHSGSMSVILAAVYCGDMYVATKRGAWTEPPTPTAAETKETGITR